jgi:subfamily B ATP-binding cassette protein MsbA
VAYRAYLIKPTIDEIFVNKDVKSLYLIPLFIFGVAIVSCVAIYAQGIIMSFVNNKIYFKLQTELFGKVIKKDMNFFKKNSGAKINAFFSDISGISEIINIFLNTLFLQFFTLAFLVGLMFYNNWKMTLISFTAFPMLIIPLKKISKVLRKLSLKNKEGYLTLSGAMGEIFDNINIVKSNIKEDLEMEKISVNIQEICNNNIKMSKKSLVVSPLIEMIGTIGFASVILYGGISVVKGVSTTGDFFTFLTSLFSAYKPAKSFSGLGVKMQDALMSARRYFLMIDRENKIIEGEKNIKKLNGEIVFKDVCFSYPQNNFENNNDFDVGAEEKPDKEVLHNINLNVRAGKSYALVGHSGSGKSTIFNLLLRFYDVTSGGIYIDGINIKDLTFKSLRGNISLVSQDIKLFNDTIYNNIKYAKANATKEEIISASKFANVDEFVVNLECGYDTTIGPNGSMLSGGQKQRISIARAFLKNNSILLLDEATSALDPISETLIKESLKKLMRNKTTIIIAHRLSTIMNCDYIFVLENGYLKEEGEHNKLMALNGTYKELHDKQFGNNEN